ncbi:MAG: sugar phosphate nucleotidyltransferase [Thermoprotei archaeon]
MTVGKAIITAAGEGSRMLPLTRGIRKEMLPLCARSESDGLTLKPLVHLIMEQLYRAGVRSFCFVIRKGEHMVKDYFTLEESYVTYLKSVKRYSEDLEALKRMISDVQLEFVEQPVPQGFGEAVYRAKQFVDGDLFALYAGDGYLLRGDSVVRKAFAVHAGRKPSATLLARKVENPSKYGVISDTKPVSKRPQLYKVGSVVEKPVHPPSNLALTAFYVFSPELMDELGAALTERRVQLELTEGIMRLIEHGRDVYACLLNERRQKWLSVGSPESYLRALEITRRRPA